MFLIFDKRKPEVIIFAIGFKFCPLKLKILNMEEAFEFISLYTCRLRVCYLF